MAHLPRSRVGWSDGIVHVGELNRTAGLASLFSNAQRTLAPQRAARLAMAAVAALIVASNPAGAASRHAERAVEVDAPREAGAPVMAIVSLKSQQVTIYDAEGW